VFEIEILYKFCALCSGQHNSFFIDREKFSQPTSVIGLEVIKYYIVDFF